MRSIRCRGYPARCAEALQLALAAEHRAESFYSDTATHARDAMVRSCAAELAEIKGTACASSSISSRAKKRVEWFGLRSHESELFAPAVFEALAGSRRLRRFGRRSRRPIWYRIAMDRSGVHRRVISFDRALRVQRIAGALGAEIHGVESLPPSFRR
jgi:hypothetical protein